MFRPLSRTLSLFGMLLPSALGLSSAQAVVYNTAVVQNVGVDLDLSAAKTYTHKLDFPGDGNSAPINGVQFSPAAAGASVDAQTGNAYTLSIPGLSTFASGNSSLVQDFFYAGSQPVGATEVLTLSNLSVGTTYEARFYYRDFGARPNTVRVDTGGGSFLVGTVDQDTAGINENYFSVTYKADASNVSFSFQQQVFNSSWHQYGVSNEVFTGNNPVQGLFNTGVGANGLPLGDNSVDPHWTLSGVGAASGAGPNAIVTTSAGGFPIGPWLGDNAVSAWITPAENTQGPGATDGSAIYFYSTQFSTTEAGVLHLEGFSAADNAVVSLAIDGIAGQFLSSGFGSFAAFTFDGELDAGLHTLTFGVQNGAGEGNPNGPNGLRVQFTAALFTPIPEPASASLLMLAMGGLVMRSRRHRA